MGTEDSVANGHWTKDVRKRYANYLHLSAFVSAALETFCKRKIWLQFCHFDIPLHKNWTMKNLYSFFFAHKSKLQQKPTKKLGCENKS